MKKSFEYDLTKYDPNAPTRTEQFLTADGAKTLTTDANNGAVLIQDSVDPDSLNPVTAAAVATAVAGASGEVPVIGDGDNGKVLKAVVDGSSKSVAWGDDSVDLVSNGGLEKNSSGAIGVKVDGTTIDINENGELEAIGGGSGSEVLAYELQLTWDSTYNYASYTIPTDVREKLTPGAYMVNCYVQYGITRPLPEELASLSTPLNIHAGVWAASSGREASLVVLPSSNTDNTLRTFEMSGMFIIEDASFSPGRFEVRVTTQMNVNETEPPYRVKYYLTKL